MADYAIHEETLTDVADVIRKKDGTSALIDPADYADRINLMGMLEEKTVSGAIATFADGADAVPLKKCEITLPASLDGYSRVDINHTGSNLWDEAWELGAINVTNGQNVANNNFIRSTNYIPVSPNTVYYKCAPQNYLQLYYGKDKTYLSYGSWNKNTTFTTPANCYFVRFYVAQEYGTTYNNDIALNYPSTFTEYAHYSGDTYNIEIPNPNPNLRLTADVDDGMWTESGTINPSSGGGFGRAFTMAVSEKTTYDIYGLLDDLIVYLDSNKTMLSYERLSNTALSLQNERKTTPANCAYIGLSALAFDVSSVSVKESFLVRGGSIDAINGDGVNGCSKPVSLNSRTWYKTTIGGHDCFYSNLTNGYIGEGSGFVDGDCDSYDVTFDGQMGTDKTIRFYYNSNFNFTRCAVRDDQYANLTASEFKAIVDGDMVYQLAESAQTAFAVEPISVDSKANSNNIWNDAGDTEVTYRSQGTVYQYPEGEGVSF